MSDRRLKDLLCEQVARIGSAVASPKRLEILELLAQGEKTVEALAAELAVDVEFFPGHQAGSVCGAGLSGKPSSTTGFEKRWNPGLSMDRGTLVEYRMREAPPRPTDIDRIVAANLAA
jgi:hypothetical protein